MLRLVDVSRYQVETAKPFDLAKAQAAGYHIANIALTGGRGYVSGDWAPTCIDRARKLGMGVSTYHWLDGRTSGAAQARAQLARLRGMFGTRLGGFGHCVDIEETGEHGITPPAWAHVRDYVNAMQDELGRHIAVYSGRWWWAPKGWPGATLTPWLMGAPMGGYVDTPPSATAVTWTASYGGWQQLAIMQWGVAPLPGTGDCSLSIIRDHGVWADLTGGDALMPQADPGNAQPEAWAGPAAPAALLDELDDMARRITRHVTGHDDVPGFVAQLNRQVEEHQPSPLNVIPYGAGEICAPVISAEMNDWIECGGSSSGCVGDSRHGTGFHRGADFIPPTDYSRRRDPNGADGPFINGLWACAGDFRHGGKPELRAKHKAVLALLRRGAFPMICEMIVQPDAGKPVMYWARWEGVENIREYTGSGHDLWSHLSWTRSKANQRPHLWKAVNVPLDSTDKTWLKSSDFTNAVAAAVETRLLAHKLDPDSKLGPNRTIKTFLLDVQNLRDSLIHALNDTRVKGRPLAGSGLDKLLKSADATAATLTALAAQLSTATQAEAARDQAEALRDQTNLTAIITALNEVRQDATDPVTADELHAAISRAFGDAFSRPAPPTDGE